MEVQQQAEMYQMGTLTATYQPQFTNPFAIIGLAVLAIIVDIALFVAIYNSGWTVNILVAIPILAIIYAIVGLVHCNLRVYTFTNGVIRAKGGAIDVIRYDQVSQVFFISRKGRYGSVLPFGPLNVSLQGISNGSAALPWNAMQPVILYRGNVVIKHIGQRSNFAKAKVTQVPNLPVFLNIAKYAQGMVNLGR